MWDIDTIRYINRAGSDYQPEKDFTGITVTNEVVKCKARTQEEARAKLGDGVLFLMEGNVKSVIITHMGNRTIS